MVRTRIAPSPTGEDLHIGNVYTALINFIFAKKNKGQFVVRIEDTDRTRLVEGSEERILKSLDWFGLTPDEGTKVSGPYAPYRQSERLELYKKYALDLVQKGHAYYCFCSPERLESVKKEQLARGQQPMYDESCRNRLPEEIKSKLDLKEKYVIRLRVPETGETSFEDVIRGKISFENSLIDDQILLKSDGFPTYHLAVVVDDYLMKITHIIRAEEWISSTPKHILLYNYFGWPLPVFAHGPILRNPDRSKLSKRKNPVWVSWYKERGFLPEAILNYLVLMGCSTASWAIPGGGEIFSVDTMIKNFRLEDLRPVGPAFDLKKLEWMNGEYIRAKDNEQLTNDISNYLSQYSKNPVLQTLKPSDLLPVIPLIKERLKKLSDFEFLAGFFFQKPVFSNSHSGLDPESSGLNYQFRYVTEITKTLESLSKPWTKDSWEKAIREMAEVVGVKAGEVFMDLRVAVTGNKIGPDLFDSIKILGEEEALERLKSVSKVI